MGAPRDYSLTFTGAGEQETRAVGRYVRMLETPSASVFVTVEGGSELERSAGQQIRLGRDAAPFTRLTVRSAVAQTVKFTVADEPQDDDRANVALSVAATVAGSTAATKQAAVTVPAGGSIQLVAANANRQEVRLAIPADQPGGVWYSDSAAQAADEGGWLDAGQTDYVATLSALYAFNPGVSAVVVSVLDMETP